MKDSRHAFDSPDTARMVLRLLENRPGRYDPLALRSAGRKAEWRRMVRSRDNQALLPALHYVLQNIELRVPEDARGHIEKAYAAQLIRVLTMTRTQTAVGHLLARNAVRHRFLKGLRTAQLLYPWPELRCWGDIDVLVHPRQHKQSLDILRGDGWRCIDTLPIHDTLWRDGIVLEVHRHVLGPGERVMYGIADEAIERYIECASGEEEYVLFAIKLFSEHRRSKSKILDMYLYERVPGLDWNIVGEVTRRWNASFALAVGRDMVAAFAATPRFEKKPFGVGMWRAQRLWPHIRYAVSMAHHPHAVRTTARLVRGCAGAGGVAGWLARGAHALLVFFGLRRLDLNWLRIGYGKYHV